MEPGKHILVVDDDVYIAEMVKSILESEGFTASIANNGEFALDYLHQNKTDLILLDIRMPGMDGYTVLSKIRKDSQLPVIMLSAVRDTDAVVQSMDIGAVDYIVKPFLPRELVARVRAKLRRIALREGDLISGGKSE